MCNFTTIYHTTCKHYSTKQFVYCPLAESLPTNTLPRGCHNTKDLGLETDFSGNACIKCQRNQAKALFFGNSSPEPQPISYGIVAPRGEGVPAVLVTSWVDTTHNTASSVSSGSGMTRSDSSMSLASLASDTSVSSSSSAGSYRGWSFKEGKFGNAHWRSYQDDEDAAAALAKQKAKARIALKSSQEDY